MSRKHGYYWVRIKRTQKWIIARWWPSLNKGIGFWDVMSTIEHDTRSGFDKIGDFISTPKTEPVKRKRMKEKPIKIKRIRKNPIKRKRKNVPY